MAAPFASNIPAHWSAPHDKEAGQVKPGVVDVGMQVHPASVAVLQVATPFITVPLQRSTVHNGVVARQGATMIEEDVIAVDFTLVVSIVLVVGSTMVVGFRLLVGITLVLKVGDVGVCADTVVGVVVGGALLVEVGAHRV